MAGAMVALLSLLLVVGKVVVDMEKEISRISAIQNQVLLEIQSLKQHDAEIEARLRPCEQKFLKPSK